MRVPLGMVRESAKAAVRSFTLRGFAPLLPALSLQLLYLVLGLNLGSAVGMATAGLAARWIAGPDALNYPAFLRLLPLTFSYVESATFVVIGAWALPRVVYGIWRKGDRARVDAAFLPTFLALALAFGLGFVWQALVPLARRVLGLVIDGGHTLEMATWGVSVLVGYAITTLFVYVPIVAVSSDRALTPVEALAQGFRESVRRFWITFPMALLFSAPALILQSIVQVMGMFIYTRTRPENIAYLLLAYAVLGSLGTYFLWSMATRLHRNLDAMR